MRLFSRARPHLGYCRSQPCPMVSLHRAHRARGRGSARRRRGARGAPRGDRMARTAGFDRTGIRTPPAPACACDAGRHGRAHRRPRSRCSAPGDARVGGGRLPEKSRGGRSGGRAGPSGTAAAFRTRAGDACRKRTAFEAQHGGDGGLDPLGPRLERRRHRPGDRTKPHDRLQTHPVDFGEARSAARDARRRDRARERSALLT